MMFLLGQDLLLSFSWHLFMLLCNIEKSELSDKLAIFTELSDNRKRKRIGCLFCQSFFNKKKAPEGKRFWVKRERCKEVFFLFLLNHMGA
jgi:hypothetical protein